MKRENKIFEIIIPPQDIACEPGLLKKLANGESDAYAWVYKNYCIKVYNYALLMTRSEAMSEDIVQEVFIKLWQHREKLSTVKNFNAYLYMLYRNYILDVLKGQQKQRSARHEYYLDTAKQDETAEEILSCKETRQVIARAVEQLPQQRQLVYKLGRVHGLTREEIAKELQISPFTVKGHMQKALRFLKDHIQTRV